MPWPRIEVAELLVEHLVELGEQLDDLVVRIAVVSVDVVARPVPARPQASWMFFEPRKSQADWICAQSLSSNAM